ncbi:MAG: DNA gyrase subunit A [Tissierellia bacterium]|nr:DNA gyrase subunit A [Tissierellia bacterium]
MSENKNNHDEQIIIDHELEKEMKDSYLDYAMSVIVSRALPDVRDGLKPVHRRIIYGMSELGLTPEKPYRKSARLVGDVMGKYHPHGDTAIYDAVVRLAQDFSTRYPLADGQGNFGSIDGDGAAAMRYTEIKMSKIALEMLKDINKDTVDFVPNFDESEKEPSVLPSRFPNLIVNGSSGIAVGMATNMAPHNLGEVVDGTIAYLDDNEITIEELSKIIKGPDFPTGGLIMGREGIRDAYRTGRGKIKLRAVAEIEEYKNRHRIIVTEIPYQVNKSALIMKIADHVRNKTIEGISDLRDESDRKGMRIVIDIRRDANPNVVLNNLYKYTNMQTTFGIINLALLDGVPKVFNLKELISHYVDHQIEVVTRRTQYDLDRAEARAHIVEGLRIAIDNIDRIIKIIRSSRDDSSAKELFNKEFGLSSIQGQAILDMQLKRLTGLQIEKLNEEYEFLIKEIARFKEILANPAILNEIIKEELLEIRDKYKDLRRSVITQSAEDIDIEDIIEEEDVVITLTHFGYIKRMPEGAYKPQNRGGRGISALTTREDDFVEDMFITSTHDNILFFTNKGKVFSLKAYEIPDAGRQAKGTAIINLLNITGDEKINAIVPVREFSPELFLTMVTEKGIIKRTKFDEYKNIRKNGIIAINLNDDDELIGVKLTDGGKEAIVITRNGMAIRFPETDVRSMGRTATGVKAITLDNDDSVVSFDLVEADHFLLSISEKGFGKMTDLEEYRTQNRGGKGLITYKVTDKTGRLISAKVVNNQDEVMIISQKGIVIRLATSQISKFGRNTQGVKLMDIKDSEVVAVAKYIGEE